MPEERYKEETKETKEAKETNKSCRKEGRYRRERSVKEKMKKSIARLWELRFRGSAAWRCARIPQMKQKPEAAQTPAMLHLLQIWIVCRLLIHQKSRLQAHRIQMPRTRKHRIRKHPPDRQNSHLAPTSETERGITLTEADGVLTFSFAQAGITGTAAIEKDAAVYSGDDDHQIRFLQDGTILTVTVTGAQGEESDSPLAGTYVKEAELKKQNRHFDGRSRKKSGLFQRK